MKVKDLKKLLDEFDQEKEIFIWSGNEYTSMFDYTSNLVITEQNYSERTNNGVIYKPLILTSDYKKDLLDNKKLTIERDDRTQKHFTPIDHIIKNQIESGLDAEITKMV
jgi:hypothetical protein